MSAKRKIRLKRPVRSKHVQSAKLNDAQRAAIQSGLVPLSEMALPKRVKFREFIKLAARRVMEADLGATSASLAYYALLSLFPMLILAGNLLPVFGLSYNSVSRYLSQVIPSSIMGWINPVIKNLLNSSNGGVLSIGAIGTIWAASLAINGLKNGFNKAYGVKPPQNFFVQRLLSMLMIFILVLVLASVMVAFTFGRQFLEWLVPVLGLSDAWLITFNRWRWPVTLAAMAVIVLVIYYFLPNVRMKFWTILPGSAFTVASWLLLAQAFSWYMRVFGTRFNSYGTLGTFIVLLLWLNFMAMMLLIGVVINAVVAEYFTGRIHHSKGKVHDFVRKQSHRVQTGK